MANEFKVRKGLIVNGSGSTLLDVQGSQGQLFAITDSLSGSLFTVSDISGIPIFEVRSDDTIKLGTFNAEAIIVSGSHATVSGSFSGSFQGDGSGLTNINVDNIANVVDGSGGTNQIAYWSDTDTITGDANFFYNSTQDTLNLNKIAVGAVDSEDFFRIKFTDFGGVANDVGIGLPATGSLGFNIRNGDYFQWNNGTSGEIMRLNGTGLGIGTASPSQKLEVRSGDIIISGSNPRIMFEHQNESFVHDLMLRDEGNGQLHYRYGGGTKIYFDNHSLRFGDFDSGVGTLASTQDPRIQKSGTGSTLGSLELVTNNSTRMFISSSGDIGINTTSPDTRLHIVEAGGSSQLTLERTGGGAGKAVLAGAAEGLIVFDDVYGAKMYVGTAGTYNGRVGIGTITPDEKLHVVGDIKVTGTVNVESDLNITGDQLTFTNDAASAYIRAADALFIESDYDNDDASSKPIYFRTNGSEMARMEATNATFAGTVTAATSFIADAVSTSNNDPGTDNVQVSGYGMIGNRGALYITNASTNSAANVQIGVGGVHNSAPRLVIGTGNSTFYTNILPSSDSAFNIGSSSARFSIGFFDSLRITNVVTNKILKFDGTDIDDSIMSDDGSTVTVGGDLTVEGIVTAREFHTEFVSASIIYMSGSTKFGDTSDDNHDFTGSINVLSGSLNITGPSTDPGTPLILHNSTNAAGVGIRFTDTAAGNTQYGRIVYRHSDSQSEGGGASFHFTGEPDLTLILGDATNKGRFVASTANNAAEVDYGFYGDVNTGMFQPSLNAVGLVSNGSEKIRVNTNGAEIKNGNLYIPEYLYHVGDTDTYMRFLGDEIQFHAGGVKMVDISEAGSTVIINQDSNDIDFRVEGNGDANLLFTDAGNDRVGIGTAAPATKLHVSGTADVLRVEGSGSTLFDIQGSQGQLFSVTDSLSGSLFAVGDISGIPILEVFSDTTVNIGSYGAEAIKVSGSNATVSGSFSGSFQGDGSGLTGISVTGFVDGTGAAGKVAIWSDADTLTTGGLEFDTGTNVLSVTGIINSISDTDTNITFGGSDNLRFIAGGSERFAITTTTVTSNVNMNVGSTSTSANRSLRVLTGDSNIASIEAYGSSQGTGKLYVGQASNYGGGIIYNGDDNPNIPQTTDAISFYRRSNDVETEVFRYPHNSSVVTFNDDIVVSGGDITLGGTGRIQGIDQVTSATDAANKQYVDNAVGGNTDADTVDGLHASSFIRSDADDTATGLITFTNTAAFRTIDLESSSPAVYFNDTGVSQGYHIGQNGDQFWILRDSDGNGAYNNILAHWNNNETKVYGNLIVGGSNNVLGATGTGNNYWLNGSSTEGNTKIRTHHDNSIELHAADIIDFLSGSSDISFRFNNFTSQMSIGFTTFNEALTVSGSVSASGDLSVGNGGIGKIKAPGGSGKLVLTTEKGGPIYIGESNASGSQLVHYSNVASNFATYSWTANSYNIFPGSSNRLLFKSDAAVQVYDTPFEVKNISYSSNQSNYVLRIGATNNSSWDNWGIQAKSTATGAPYTSFRVPDADNALTIVNSPAGYVGINTAAPSARLHINGGGSGAVAFKVTPGNAGKEWSIDASNPDHLKKEENIVLSADPGNVHSNTTIGFRIDGSTKAQLTSQGRLGINKTSPETELDVEGTIFGAIRRRPQMETAAGGTGINDGADTWAKLVTFDLSAANYNDLYVKYTILDSESGASGGYAELLVRLRKNATTAMDICDLQILRMSHITEGNITAFSQMLHEDSFKLINNGHADVQLWMQKKKSYGKFIVYEDVISFDGWRTSSSTYNSTITYNNNAAWQSSTPSGTNNFLQYLASTRAVHQYAFFTNYSGQHRYIPINSTFPNATPNYTHKYILPKSGRLIGVKLMVNATITNLKLKTYRMDGGTPAAHGTEKTLNLIANTPAWIKLDLNFYQSTTYTAAGFSVQPPSSTGYYFNMAAVWQF